MLNDRKFQLVFLVYSMILIFFGRQLDGGLSNFDDAYYALKAKQIFDSNSLWVVTYMDGPSFENPPFVFWLTGLAYKVFGVSTYAATFFPALMGMATVLMTRSLAKEIYKDDWIAFFAAFILIFPGMYIDGARRAMLDVPLAFCVTAAMYCFWKAQKDGRFYILYAVFTAFGVWTKSILGFFPLVIGFFFILARDGWRGLFNRRYWAGWLLAVILGSLWFLVNYLKFGNDFIEGHFLRAHMTLFGVSQNATESDPLYFLGYFRDFGRNYWPWVPFTAVAMVVFGRRAFKEKDSATLFLFLWPTVVICIMSYSANQTLRYLFMIFPALAIVTAKSISDWTSEKFRQKLLYVSIGTIMVTAIVINATPLEVKVSLKPSSVEVRKLASIINLNVPPDGKVGSYKLSKWNPKQSVIFYSGRNLDYPLQEPEQLFEAIEKDPRSTWLTATFQWRKMEELFPGKFYLIQAEKTYAYFTSAENRKNVRYDFSEGDFPPVR
ncbi:MAG: phospholipid carrier-dependent glycosyltransferase [Nitrospinae bacterium CG11_big_fil_rev_8_21_14_0_20_45_15]|nr:MAG: phospholipid carrier-dependent glycosyltransferase [Nitrospinae bacterium CG11_big_fil_rev_8_21_14_0_20_45_15]